MDRGKQHMSHASIVDHACCTGYCAAARGGDVCATGGGVVTEEAGVARHGGGVHRGYVGLGRVTVV